MKNRKDSAQQKDLAAPGTREQPSNSMAALCDDLMEGFWQDTLRAAFSTDGAVERCSRRGCKKAGTCQMAYTRGHPLDCGGGEPEVAVQKAAFGAFVGSAMIMSLFQALANRG